MIFNTGHFHYYILWANYENPSKYVLVIARNEMQLPKNCTNDKEKCSNFTSLWGEWNLALLYHEWKLFGNFTILYVITAPKSVQHENLFYFYLKIQRVRRNQFFITPSYFECFEWYNCYSQRQGIGVCILWRICPKHTCIVFLTWSWRKFRSIYYQNILIS